MLPCILLSLAIGQNDHSVVFDISELSSGERLAAEALQGIVNRDGPKLFLGAPDDRWLAIYEERNGLRYETQSGFRDLLARYRDSEKGLVVYDPGVDAGRYVATTLAGIEDLIPVSPSMLAGRTPSLRASRLWAGCDFSAETPEILAEMSPAAGARIALLPGEGLEVIENIPDPAQPYAFTSLGPVTVDLARWPVLEVEVASLTGEDAQWAIKLTWDRDGNGRIDGGEDDLALEAVSEPGVRRWNVAEMAGLTGEHAFARVQLHVLGESARVVWKSVRFVSETGDAPELSPAVPLTDLGLPVVHDLRGRFENSVEAYDWALRELMPRCNRRFAHSACGPCEGFGQLCGPMWGYDWVTLNRGFAFNLVPSPEVMPSYGGAPVGGSPEQAAMYRRILEALETPCEITGYGEPEDYWCKLISEHGHYSFHFGTNWSFHSKVPIAKRLEQPIRFTPENVVPEDKYYVCFMTSEGDTMKGPLPFFMDSWFDPDRGRIPFNWGVSPLMASHFPAMLDYFYAEATPNDYCFAGCSGAGYIYPDFMPNVPEFARWTRDACRAADLPCVDIWMARKARVRAEYAANADALALTVNDGRARMTMAPNGTLIVDHGLMYWQNTATGGEPYYRVFREEAGRAKAVDWLVDRIEAIAERHAPPFVILVYADLHSYDRHVMVHREAADKLDPQRFKVARMDEALAAVTRWSRERVLVGAEGFNERLAYAALEGAETRLPVRLVNGGSETANVVVRLDEGKAESVALEAKETRDVWLRVEDATVATVTVRVGATGYPASLCSLPAPEGVASADMVALWDAATLSHQFGSLVKRPDAMWGEAWISPGAGRQAGALVFGPYEHLDPGRYLVAYRMMLAEGEAPAPDDELCTVDINQGHYDGLGFGIGKRVVSGSDLSAGAWTWITTTMDWPGDPSRAETRVTTTGAARLIVDRIAVFRIP